MARLRTSRLASLGALLFVCLMGSVFAQERFARQVSFDIAAQSVEAALLEFSKQADVQVMVGTSSLNGQKTEGVKGKLAVKDALQQLLKNTGLEYRTEGNGTVTIRSAAAAKTDARVLPLVDGARLASRDAAGEAAGNDALRVGESAQQAVETLDEVVVTGTHIRGDESAGSRVQIIDRQEIDATGYATVNDVLGTLPQNLGGGPSEDFDDGTTGNFNKGVGVNLRGLGADATLVLVDGQRQAAGGTEGAFVDISTIPVSAVQRIEVLPEGASAIYGSDAVGGVVNVVLRQDYNGAETRMRLGTAGGDATDTQVSQLYGRVWESGNVLLGYQYDEREALARSNRAFTSTDDQRRYGGDDFRLFLSNPGNILDPLTSAPVYAIPSGQDGRGLTPADFLPGIVNVQSLAEGGDLLPRRQSHSTFMTANYHVTDEFSLNADARYSERRTHSKLFPFPTVLLVPNSNPFYVSPDPANPFPFVLVAYNMSDDLGLFTGTGTTKTFTGGLGATTYLPRDWRAVLHVGYAQEKLEWSATNLFDNDALSAALADPNPETAFNPFGDGSNTNPQTLESIRLTQHERASSNVVSANLLADGTLFDLPSGPAKMAVGLDYRAEELERGALDRRTLDRNVSAAFAELSLPIWNGNGTQDGRPQLQLSLASRYEHYSDFGSTLNPKIGVTWVLNGAVSLRGTWGTSFKAPQLVDLDESPRTNAAVLTVIPDPNSLTGDSFVLIREGNNSQLTEESADTWTAGLDFNLWNDSASDLSITYFDIDYQDRILKGGPPGASSNILLQEEQWAALVQRQPSASDIDAICNSAEFVGDPANCTLTPPAAIIDLRLRNLGSVRVRGVDLSVSKELPTALGIFGFTVAGTKLLKYGIAASEQSWLFDVRDTVGNPLSFRVRAGASWSTNGWTANTFANYVGAYDDTISQPARNVACWTTFDLNVQYAMTGSSSWLDGLVFALSATNLFDKEPPFVNARDGYDTANADLIGRVVSAQVTKSWQ